MHIYIIACTGARYNVYVHVQPMHAIMYWGVVNSTTKLVNRTFKGAVPLLCRGFFLGPTHLDIELLCAEKAPMNVRRVLYRCRLARRIEWRGF